MNSLVPLYREMAADGTNFQGLSILQHKTQIGKLIRTYDVKTLLDFGCGRGDAYRSPHKVHHDWGLKRADVFLHDPAFPQYEKLPGWLFDMVVCSDVLEHVPVAEVDEFVQTLFAKANKLVWASVCCRAAKKTFPQTGENLHVTVRDYAWWFDTFTKHRPNFIQFVLVETP